MRYASSRRFSRLTAPTSGIGITNLYLTNATLDFASTSAGTTNILTINLTNVSEGDFVTLSPPSATVRGVVGTFTAWAENGFVSVQYYNGMLVSAQDPASGNFRVKVEKVK